MEGRKEGRKDEHEENIKKPRSWRPRGILGELKAPQQAGSEWDSNLRPPDCSHRCSLPLITVLGSEQSLLERLMHAPQ